MDEKNSEKYGYPVGKLEDIHVYFTHYETFEQSKQKWIECLMRQYRSAYYIPKSEVDIQNVKNLCDYQSKFTGKRWLDEFDWISFLNER